MVRIKAFVKEKIIYIISFLFFLIPLLWFKPGEMDLGGDSSRLYFYDPVGYLFSHTLWGISPSGLGGENISYYVLPFNLLLVVLRQFFTATFTIQLFHGLAIASSFLFVALIIKTLLEDSSIKQDKNALLIASITGGVFYVLSPAPILGWDKVILTHDQIFLNPLIFYLLLRYFISRKTFYAFLALFFSFTFSHNFSFPAAPPFFAFYPLSLLFLLIIVLFIKKIHLNIREIFILGLLFLGLHAFHLVPQIWSILNSSSASSAALFSDQAKFDRGLSYFISIAPNIKVIYSLLNVPQMTDFPWYFWVFIVLPVVTVAGLIYSKSKIHILTAAFFLITLFLVTANITTTGYEIYRKLFAIPGFSMFRNFFGQFSYVFLFFYSLLFGQSLYTLISRFQYLRILLPILVIFMFLVTSYSFIAGDFANKSLWQSKDVKIVSNLNPDHENAILYMRSLPDGGKVLTLPLSDPGYQIVMGGNGGAYQGPSTIAYLTGKKDFSGIDELGAFRETFLNLVKNDDYEGIKNLLSILDIQYIFYNSDPDVYEDKFPNFPYTEAKKSLPRTQKEYKDFIKKLGLIEKMKYGYITIYETVNKKKTDLAMPDVVVPVSASFLDWNYFTTSYDISNKELVILPSYRFSNVPGIIIPNPLTQLDTAVKDYPIEVTYPYVRWKMGSIPYNYVLYRENQSKNQATDPQGKISLHLALASKRIAELDKWGGEIDLDNVETRDILSIDSGNFDFSSWEKSMQRYYDEMHNAILIVNDPQVEDAVKVVQKKKILQTLKLQRSKLREIALRNKDATYLLTLTNEIFEKLQAELQHKDDDHFYYVVNATSERNYEVSLSYDKEVSELISQSVLQYGEIKKQPEQIDTEKRIVSFGKIPLSEKNTLISFSLPPVQIDENSTWQHNESDIAFLDSGETTYSLDNMESVVKKANNWNPEERYKLTFDYHTYGKTFEFNMLLQEKGKDPYSIMKDNRNVTSWTNFTAYVDSGTTSGAQFVITNLGQEKNKIALKNYSLTRVYKNPSMQLIGENPVENIAPPKYSSRVINPTKYIISLDRSKNTSVLVLPQAFSSNWKLYPVDKNKYSNIPTEKYSLAKIFNFNIFDRSVKDSVNEESHSMANGYANAWLLSENKDRKTYVVEYIPQRNFYFGLAISLISLIATLFLSIYIFMGGKDEKV